MDVIRSPLGIAAFFWIACTPTIPNASAGEHQNRTAMQLTSTAFSEGGPIPARFTCDGSDASPALKWSGVPSGAKSLVLLADDPDAPVGTCVHWVLFDLPASSGELKED